MSEHEQQHEGAGAPGVPEGPAKAPGAREPGAGGTDTADADGVDGINGIDGAGKVDGSGEAGAAGTATEGGAGADDKVAGSGTDDKTAGSGDEDKDGADEAPETHAVPVPHDRNGARALFVELRELPEGSPEKAELRNRLVRMHLPLVEHLARRFRNRGEPLDDLTQVATIGLIKSVDRFDPERGVEFSTYATPTVVGEIKRHFRDKGWAVRVPRRLQELRLSLTTATAELSQQHGRSPTVHELAERLGISEEEVLEGLESANAYSTLSLDVPDTDDESPAVADTLGAEDEALEGVEYRESLKPLLEDLPPREKRILLLRFFGNMTQSQIAQEVGISQMHVSRLLARTLAQLREKLLVEE
ncbi:SigB/SigF/SigG family RNA polymerase sigma factor [Streptomyces sp. WAC08241]|uniref:SigB/SigF/SigG family RNA polymerase sigma factor n=1 Tax=Streptomyces sp. WAC08241 TaxID=2487421 RepID=UPI0021B040FD|nr:SigB/SigF/SigG family RNA polymerase sigma factor [Streptomyces sp. WAC08241]